MTVSIGDGSEITTTPQLERYLASKPVEENCVPETDDKIGDSGRVDREAGEVGESGNYGSGCDEVGKAGNSGREDEEVGNDGSRCDEVGEVGNSGSECDEVAESDNSGSGRDEVGEQINNNLYNLGKKLITLALFITIIVGLIFLFPPGQKDFGKQNCFFVDVGTTTVCAALYINGNIIPFRVSGRDGAICSPSVVYLDFIGGDPEKFDILVGQEAFDKCVTENPKQCAKNFKMYVSEQFVTGSRLQLPYSNGAPYVEIPHPNNLSSYGIQFQVGESKIVFPVEELQTLLVKKVLDYAKSKVEKQLEGNLPDKIKLVNHVGLATPATKHIGYPSILADSAKILDVNLVSVHTEPESSLFALFEKNKNSFSRGIYNVAVLDWGGGSFDIAVLRVEVNTHGLKVLETVGFAGTEKIGGHVFTDTLLEFMKKKLIDEDDVDPKQIQNSPVLWKIAEEAKILSSDNRLDTVPTGKFLVGNSHYSLHFYCDELDELWKPHLEYAKTVLHTLNDIPGVSTLDLPVIALTGGGSHGRGILEMVEAFFPNSAVVGPSGKSGGRLAIDSAYEVTRGLAIAYQKTEGNMVSPFLRSTIGVKQLNGGFEWILLRNSKLPCFASSRQKILAGARFVNIPIYQKTVEDSETILAMMYVPVTDFSKAHVIEIQFRVNTAELVIRVTGDSIESTTTTFALQEESNGRLDLAVIKKLKIFYSSLTTDFRTVTLPNYMNLFSFLSSGKWWY